MKTKLIAYFTFCMTLVFYSSGISQVLLKSFKMETEPPEERLTSNTVQDIVPVGNTIWFGTGQGLSKTSNAGLNFLSYGREQGIGNGGVSGLAANDEIIWVATGFDSLTVFGFEQAGGGLAYSQDEGATWHFIEQPGGTPVQNITFDMAIRDDEIWIASFGGGLRKSSDLGETWSIVPPDSFIFDPGGRLNHRAFAVTNADGVLWVGTALGINRSVDGGVTWTNFNRQNQPEPISGNFVVSLANQKINGKNIIWASTRETTVESGDTSEFRGVSWSEDFGFSWKTGLRGETVHNIGFMDSVVFAASEKGLHISVDIGETWLLMPPIENGLGTRQILAEEVFFATADENNNLWVSTSNGLANTANFGATWEVFQVFEKTGQDGEPRTYAYPNPFSPNVHNQLQGDGFVRFQYNTKSDTRVTLKIYNFAMEDVYTVAKDKARTAAGDFYEIWNGRDSNNEVVANGVYFYQIELDGDGSFWGKLIVMN